MLRKIKDFIRGIKNLKKYFWLIWKDRDWDHSYCEDILLFKLKEMQKQLILTKYPIVNWKYHKKEAQALKLCIQILERRSNNFYIHTWKEDRESTKIINDLEERDWKIYNKLFELYFQSWWD